MSKVEFLLWRYADTYTIQTGFDLYGRDFEYFGKRLARKGFGSEILSCLRNVSDFENGNDMVHRKWEEIKKLIRKEVD